MDGIRVLFGFRELFVCHYKIGARFYTKDPLTKRNYSYFVTVRLCGRETSFSKCNSEWRITGSETLDIKIRKLLASNLTLF